MSARHNISRELLLQSRGAYANLFQKREDDLSKALTCAEAPVRYFDDPIRLALPYEYMQTEFPNHPTICLRA